MRLEMVETAGIQNRAFEDAFSLVEKISKLQILRANISKKKPKIEQHGTEESADDEETAR